MEKFEIIIPTIFGLEAFVSRELGERKIFICPKTERK